MSKVKDALVTLVCRFLSLVCSFFIPSSPSPSFPSSVIVIKPCCIGDVLMATAAIAQARVAFPKARIAVAVGPWAKEVLTHNPKIDELIDCGSVGSGGPIKLGDYLSLLEKVRRGKFQVGIVLDRSPIISLIPFLAGIPFRVGIDSGGRGFSLTAKVKPKLLGHEVELYLDVVRALAPTTPEPAPKLEFFPTDEAMTWAGKTVGEASLGAKAQSTLVAIHPGGGINPGRSLQGKRWPPERFASVAAKLISRGAMVVLVGGAGDEEASTQTKASLEETGVPLAGHLLDLTGRTTLDKLGAVLKGCHLYIGNDSGPMHLAVAVGTPVVALFGPSKPEVYGPYPSGTIIYKGELCSGCLFRGGSLVRCRSKFQCMREITAEEVWEQVAQALGCNH